MTQPGDDQSAEVRVSAADAEETMAWGKRLGRATDGHGLIFLHGDLGAGKTTFSRGVLRAFGHQGAVKSPTYTLVEPYELGEWRIYHFDLYRLGDPEELEYLGIRDYFEGRSLSLVEWSERGVPVLPPPDLEVFIELQGMGRELCFRACSPQGLAMLRRLTGSEEARDSKRDTR